VIGTNLATRPFYNVRAVSAALGLFALLVLAITLINVVQGVRLSATQQALGAQAEAAEQQARLLRQQAADIRTRIDRQELEVVAKAAREANALIDQRTFSWTRLFSYLEATLPAEVRITAISPRPSQRLVIIGAETRSVEDLDAFIAGLESTGAFTNVLATNELTMESGLIEVTLQGTYAQSLGAASPAPDAGAAPAEPEEPQP
jgi:Tfp pilus assembly protein PilN